MRTLIAAVLLLAPLPAAAQTFCQISVEADFGIYSTTSRNPDTTIGRVEIFCHASDPLPQIPRVTLGTGSSGNSLDRVMRSGDNELHYNLYAEVAHRRVLGDGSNGTVPFPPPRFRTINGIIFPAFGMIPPRQRVPPGEYTDTVLIQVEF